MGILSCQIPSSGFGEFILLELDGLPESIIACGAKDCICSKLI
jgi:hypothetical protein